jgi:riboflavin synthase
MFTGLVETTGRVVAARRAGDEARLRIAVPFASALGRGASVAVDGVCLTVAARGRGWFEAVVSPQTLSCTTLGLRAAGERVHLERPLRLGDPFGGHLVQGHVDGVGVVESVRPEGSGSRLRIGVPAGLHRAIVPKGSIAVDGVSLTVAGRSAGAFEAALIPETLRVTRMGEYAPGTPVNLEVDMLGRYVAEMLQGRWEDAPSPAAAVTREHLARHGFGGRPEGSS